MTTCSFLTVLCDPISPHPLCFVQHSEGGREEPTYSRRTEVLATHPSGIDMNKASAAQATDPAEEGAGTSSFLC